MNIQNITIILIVAIISYIITKNILASLLIGILCSLFLLRWYQPKLMEGMKSGSRKHKKRKKTKKKHSHKKVEKDKKGKKKYKLDFNKSFYHNYKNLSSNQVSGLNKDTKSLIKTQKNLMKTLQEMGPVLSQGKSIISAFDKFFGSGDDKSNEVDIKALAKMVEKK